MSYPILKKCKILIVLLLVSLHVHGQENTSKDDFLHIAKYLSAGSGSWRALNPNFNPQNPASSSEFELKFTLDLRANLLHIVHYAYQRDTSRITSESYWLWHPGEQTIKYYSIDINGNITDGKTFMTADDTFYTVAYRYNTNGKIELRKDTNLILSENEHSVETTAFRQGRWQTVANFSLKKSD